MLSLKTARHLAARYISDLSSDAQLCDDPILSGDFGWVFAFQSEKYIDSDEMRDSLVGNAPILIDKKTSLLYPLGTAHSVEFYVNNYIRFGDPSKISGSVVEIIGWRSGANKVRANKAIRNHSKLGLKSAKQVVDDCLYGNSPKVKCASISDAELLVVELSNLGFDAKHLPDVQT